MKNIIIKKARIHNLKGEDVVIPKNKLIAVTGVSGSGKSSIVFDIVFEEGRKQYLQSLGILQEIDYEDKFESISGIGPAIAVQQNIIRQSNPRSTVGSKTNILNLLALLFSSEGKIACSSCGTLINNNGICEKCGNTEERFKPGYFSYNSPEGMCLKCSGRGYYNEFNMEKLIPDKNTTLKKIFDSIEISPGYAGVLERNFKEYLDLPYTDIPDEIKAEIIYGHYVSNNYSKKSVCLERIFHDKLYKENINTIDVYKKTVCSECHGYRIGEEARRVLLNNKHIGEIGKMSLTETQKFYDNLRGNEKMTVFGRNLLDEIINKTNNLILSRLGYLSLYREIPTLSGGELQRLFLNSHLESKMDSLIYVFDEPTAGLHESEKNLLRKALLFLKESGNTVIVVEHDKNTVEMAEHIIDIGPEAGINGGRIVYEGTYNGLLKCEESITGRYFSGKIKMPARKFKHDICNEKNTSYLTIKNAETNNLKNITVSIPLGCMTGIAGISGSGKSSLISDTLIPMLKKYFKEESKKTQDDYDETDNDESFVESRVLKLEGTENISGFIEVNQEPIGRHMNSNPVTYVGLWNKIRELFAKQEESVKNNFSAGYFSFNSKGACVKCNGSGREKIWLGGDFFIFNLCGECHGKRYNEDVLSVKYKDKNIAEILEMSILEAVNFFEEIKGIASVLKIMERFGMGYIKLGQPAPTLSGGEAQRLKLAGEISKKRKGNILYVLDEPTTGLSLYDTDKLLDLLDELVAKGNSVIVIEHDPEVLRKCDWIIELGPGSGIEGGEIIAEGSTLSLKQNQNSITGRYL